MDARPVGGAQGRLRGIPAYVTPNPLERAIRTIVRELSDLDYRYALVGGLAVSSRVDPRLTRDADLAVSVADDSDAERLVAALRARYEVLAIVEQEETGRLATVRLVNALDEHALIVDLLFASVGIEPEIVGAAEDLEILPELTIPVATVAHLIAMKLLARDDRRRPADADDLAALAAIATEDDWVAAAVAVRLIVDRGANRGRDLISALSHLREDGAY